MSLNLLGLTTLALAAFQSEKGIDPAEALRRSLERRPGVNIEAYMEKPFQGGDTMRLRLRVDAGGRRRTEVIGPMAMQGRVFIDDGTSYIAYFPDERLVRVHSAPPREDDLDRRMRLIRKHYQLEIDGRPTVAGRAALVVVATPRDAALRTQRFTLDAATFVPLRTETVDALGNVAVKFRVSRISFPSRLDREMFEIPAGEGIRRETRSAPAPVRVEVPRGLQDSERRLGFAPAFARVPGFAIQGADLLDWHGIKTMAIRLDDGLVRVTVFQFRPGGTPAPAPRPDEGPRVSQDVDGVRIEVRGDDVPVSVRERALAAYVKAMQRRAKAQEP